MSTEAPQKVIHLNRYYHFTELMRDPSVEGELVRYESLHDGSTQSALILRPTGRTPRKLFIFFHGMDGDCGDGVVLRDLVKRSGAMVVGLGGRGPAWISTAFLADVEQVIRTYAADFADYYLIGVSMGGTQALSLAGLLPDELRQRIKGVIALIPGCNLQEILERSSNERVKSSLRASAGGDPSLLEQRSPTETSRHYRAGLPFVIFYNREDSILLADELERFVASLRARNHKVATFSNSGEHNFTFENFDYEEALGRLGSDSTETSAPLIEGDV